MFHLGNFDQSMSVLPNIYYLCVDESEICYHSDDTEKISISKIQVEKLSTYKERIVYYTDQEEMASFD